MLHHRLRNSRRRDAVTGTRIPLRHGASWVIFTVIYLAIAGFCGFLVVDYANEQPALAVAGAAAALLGALAIAVVFLAGARRAPTLSVDRDGLVVDLPGVLRDPLLIPRQQVRHVYMRDASDIRNDRPRGFGHFRRRDVPTGEPATRHPRTRCVARGQELTPARIRKNRNRTASSAGNERYQPLM